MMINLVELLMYLYYNKEKDIIYHSDSPHSDEILFCSYEENGWKQSDEISIADSGFTFRILSNFGYGSKSYFHFVAKYKDCLLCDFEGSSSTVAVNRFSVQLLPDKWEQLFLKLEQVYSEKECWNINSFSRALFSFDSDISNLDESELGKKSNLILRKISLFLSTEFAVNQSANPLVAPYLKNICSLGVKIIRYNLVGVGCEVLSEDNRKESLDVIYNFLKKTNQEQLLFSE